jgi:hypothetical protein
VTDGKYLLVFNPNHERGSKRITFGTGGQVTSGQNENEHSWAVKDGKLLIQSDGKIHSRFNYDPATAVWTHTPASDTLSRATLQLLIPTP